MQRWFRFHRDLGLQLLALYLLLIIPFLATLWFFDTVVGERIQNDVVTNDLSLARAIAQETELSINNALKAVEELAKYPGVIAASPTAMENSFSILLRTRPDVNLVYRLDSDGIMLYHYPVGPGSTVGTDFSFRDYYLRALKSTQPLVSQGRISPTTEQAVATAVMPIWSADGSFLGLVGTNIRLESLSDTLSAIVSEHQAEEGLQLVILDSSAQIIAYPDPTLLLQPASVLMPNSYGHVLAGESGTVTETDPSHEERLYTYAPIPEIGWGVIVSRPTATAFSTQIFLRRVVIVAAATFVLIGLFFWRMLILRVISPIERLAPTSEAIGLNNPIRSEERVILEAQARRSDQVGHLTRSILKLEELIADRMKEQATLLETSTAVVSSLDLRTVLDRILEQASRLLDVRMSAIIALDEQVGVFRIRASRGLSSQFAEQLTIQPTEPSSVTMRALHSREPIQVSDTETDPSYTPQRPRSRAEGYRAVLAVPLNTQYAPPTALLVFHPKPHEFSHNEIQLLSNFANQATMALENAVLYERSDMRLKEQTRRLEALIQSLQDGLILSNLSGAVVYANRRIGELADLPPEALSGAPIDRVLSRILEKTSDVDSIRKEVNSLLERKSNQRVELSLLVLGRTVHLRLDTFDVTDTNNIPIGRGLILHDITADHELDRMKSSLVSTVSHELRTPLAAIKGYATTLLADDVEWDRESQREFLSIISDESDRLSNLVNNLLDLSRIEAGSLMLSRDECDLDDIIQRAARQAQLQPGNRFEVQMEANLPKLFADRPRLETVLRNLIENSVKYAGEHAMIHIDIKSQSENIIFRVSDDGPGIPEEESQRIFESYYQVNASLARISSGAGLGLAICQGLIRAHGGEIWVENQKQGACIAFSIPLSTRAGNVKPYDSIKAAQK
ncbi:MAG: GAF domain-containing protein [Anaerolineales bacterium]|nr:GAF domain-containing protein [Anaerolineales bacterium]